MSSDMAMSNDMAVMTMRDGAGQPDVGPDTLVLGIETSCDETAAALVLGGTDVVSSVVSSSCPVAPASTLSESSSEISE